VSTINDHPVDPTRLGALIRLEAQGQLSNTAARQIFSRMEHEPTEPLGIATRDGLLKVSDESALVGWIDEVLAESPGEAARFLAGEIKLQGVLVGQVMKKSKGAADPKKVNQMLAARVS
jgi:aspartyl-tRNA(Asn)/glutamyl-tRNA(Gln) amidotransferase subunit B